MKTILLALSLFAGSFFMKVFANNVSENPAVVAAFESRFGLAKDVQWSDAGSMFKVRFTLDGNVANAYYSPEGTLVAITQQLSPDSLPASLKSSLRSEMGQRWITDLFEVRSEKGITWYVTLEDANGTTVMQSTGARKWKRFVAGTAL
jgi:hypothetical protein